MSFTTDDPVTITRFYIKIIEWSRSSRRFADIDIVPITSAGAGSPLCVAEFCL